MNDSNVNNTLVFSIIENHPRVYNCSLETNSLLRSEECSFPGYMAEIVSTIMQASGIHVQLLHQTNEQRLKYGYIEAGFRTMRANLSNSFVIPLTPTAERLRYFKRSKGILTLTEEIVALSTAEPSNHFEDRVFNLLTIFDWELWICIFALLILNQLFVKLTVLSKKGALCMPSTSRFTAFALAFFTFLFVGLYRTGLLTTTIFSNKIEMFNSLQELANLVESGQLRIIARPNQQWTSAMRQVTQGPVGALSRAIQRNDHVKINEIGTEGVLDLLRTGDYVFVTSEAEAMQYSAYFCNVHLLKLREFGMYENGFLFSQDTPDGLITRINKSIDAQMSTLSGLMERYRRFLDRKLGNCTTGTLIQKHKALHFDQLVGAFLFLPIAASGSLIILGLELFWSYRSASALDIFHRAR